MSPREHNERSYRNQQQNYNNNSEELNHNSNRNHQQNHVNDVSYNTNSNSNYASLVRYVADSWNKVSLLFSGFLGQNLGYWVSWGFLGCFWTFLAIQWIP
jgi:glutamate synthase domain-containing protein 3